MEHGYCACGHGNVVVSATGAHDCLRCRLSGVYVIVEEDILPPVVRVFGCTANLWDEFIS